MTRLAGASYADIRPIFLVAALLLTGRHAFAQTTGVITGVVADEQGLPVPGATVELVSEQTGAIQPTTSEANGAFTVSAVPPGAYTLRVTMQGFKATERRAIQLRSGETLNTGKVALGVGQFSEVTTVTAGTAVVQTDTAAVSTTLEAAQVDALVSRGRDPMDLIRRLPGVSVSGDGPSSLGGVNGTAMPNINGFAAGAVAISLDGMTTNDADTNVQVSTIGVDAIEEINVNTTGYRAEYGRNAGATVSIISKSGTNQFHGGYSYYMRHERPDRQQLFQHPEPASEAGVPLQHRQRDAGRADRPARAGRQQVVLLPRARGLENLRAAQRDLQHDAHGAGARRRFLAERRYQRPADIRQGSGGAERDLQRAHRRRERASPTTGSRPVASARWARPS